jgi:hypothetical protein
MELVEYLDLHGPLVQEALEERLREKDETPRPGSG